MRERIEGSFENSSVSNKKSDLSFEYHSESLDKAPRKPFHPPDFSEQLISSEQIKKHQGRRNVFRESLITNNSNGDLDDPIQAQMTINKKKISFKDSFVDVELNREAKKNSKLAKQKTKSKDMIKQISSCDSQSSSNVEADKPDDLSRPRRGPEKLRAFSFSYGPNDHKKSLPEDKKKDPSKETIDEENLASPKLSKKTYESPDTSIDRPQTGYRRKPKNSYSETYSQQNETPTQKKHAIHNTNVLKFKSTEPISRFNMDAPNPINKICTDSLNKQKADQSFRIKPLVICSNCDHVQTFDFGNCSRKFSPIKSQNYWKSLTKNSSSLPLEQKEIFNQQNLRSDSDLIEKNSFVSDKQSFSKKPKLKKLAKNKSDIFLSSKLDTLVTSSISRESRDSISKRKMTKSSIEINVATSKPFDQESNLHSQSQSQFLKRENSSVRTSDSQSKGIVKQLLLQLSNPTRDFSEHLIHIHNKFMVQSGRSICVSVCETCETLFRDDSTFVNDDLLKEKFTHDSSSSKVKLFNFADKTSDLSETEFAFRKRSSMDAKLVHEAKRLPSLASNSRPGNSFHTRNSLAENLRRFRSNTLNSREEKYVPFCFCTFCQFNLVKSIKNMETKDAGREPEVRLRLNKLKMEYMKMERQNRRGRQPKQLDHGGSDKNSLSLSEKIMKGVIDNLLLKSLNDSRDDVRIQTLNSLNLISSDFVYFLVSSKWPSNPKTTTSKSCCCA